MLSEREETPAANLALDDVAVFLDLDGTIVDLASDPDAVRLPQEIVAVLGKLAERLNGALAIISGRPLDQLNRLLGSLELPRAGLHGLERPDVSHTDVLAMWSARLEPARSTLGWALAGRPRLRLEDKGATIAVHFRQAPGEALFLGQLLRELLARLGPDFEILEGAFVKELRPRICDKGEAVRSFMAREPFRGRRPIYVGDDITDLDAFRAVESLGGTAVAVGSRIEGKYRLSSPAAVRRWLLDLVSAGESVGR